ncbi:MAG: hypothetical protein GY939_25995 [Actinomycetia bacterium]|nr:hypothetical protein [Actinomycetes bacterium]
MTSVAHGRPDGLDPGPELATLVEALTLDTIEPPTEARTALVAATSEEATERAVAVCATFQMMNRLLDGTGTPMPVGLEGIASMLGFDPADLYHNPPGTGS